MVSQEIAESKMFNFSSRLFFNKHAISKKTGEVSLYLYVYISDAGKYESEKFPLRLRWVAAKVDTQNSLLLPRRRADEDVNDYNLIIMSERARYNEIAKMYRLKGRSLTMKLFRRELRYNDPSKSLTKYMDNKRTELYNKREISLQTWKNVGSTIRILNEFQDVIRFDEIDEPWMRSFKNYLRTTNISKNPKTKRVMKPGTIWTRMRDLKAYLAMANKEATISVNEDAINFPNPEPKQETTYCTRDEIRRLMILLRSGYLTPIQHNVLRAFLFTCFTSLRVSDLYRANTDWLVADDMLVFTQWKNRERHPKVIRIPLTPLPKSLLSEAKAKFFELPTEQEYNRTLKELAKMAEIRKNLTSHVGRHTFGYLYMTSAGNLYGLKEIMGHSKISTTYRYAHIDDDYGMNQVLKIQEGFEDLAPTVMKKIS